MYIVIITKCPTNNALFSCCLLQVVLELCQSKEITDRETISNHLERIKTLVSSWAAQVCLSQQSSVHIRCDFCVAV